MSNSLFPSWFTTPTAYWTREYENYIKFPQSYSGKDYSNSVGFPCISQ